MKKRARQRFGNHRVEKTKASIQKVNKSERHTMEERFNAIFQSLADVRHLVVTERRVQELIEKWWQKLNKIGTYSLEAFESLGEMYVQDERFMKNIDHFGEGVAIL